MDRLAIRSMLRTSGLYRPTAVSQLALRSSQHNARFISMQPRVAEVSFWKSMIPKPLRSENRVKDPNAPNKAKSKDWNPATFFIIIFLLIGSMSIQMISLRKNFEAVMRRSDVRIALLREVVERIQNGETVDVERVLGSGDPDKEAGWEEVLNEIEKDTTSRSQRKHQDKQKASGLPAPSTKIVATEETQTDPAAQTPSKGRTAYFF